MISKELLSEVLKKEVIDVFKVVKSNLRYEDTDLQHINIYELMHLMKEWALKDNRVLTVLSGQDINGFKICNIGISPNKEYFTKQFIADTEFEAVTKASEWILKQHKGE